MISNTSAPSPAKPVLMPGAYAVEDLAKKKERQRSKRLTRQSIRSGASKDKRGGKDAKNEKGGKSSKSGKKVTDTALEELEKKREKQRLKEKKRAAKQSIADEISSAWKEAEGFHLLPVPAKTVEKPEHRTRMVCTHFLKSAGAATACPPLRSPSLPPPPPVRHRRHGEL